MEAWNNLHQNISLEERNSIFLVSRIENYLITKGATTKSIVIAFSDYCWKRCYPLIMFIALNENNERIDPQKGIKAFCPACKKAVIAKMGRIVTYHWAHKEKCDCDNGKGMTQWHYKWIERHYKKQGWEVEWRCEPFRFDCFNQDKRLVLEIQSKPVYEYFIKKTDFVLSEGYKIKWVFHQSVMSSLTQLFNVYQATTRRRLVILDLLQMYSNNPNVEFYIDSHAIGSNGESSKGLLLLKPMDKELAKYPDYYRIPYVEYTKG